jgi:phosphoribosylglycinamide formyltransferase-1
LTQVAVFASGKGSNFRVIYKKIQDGYLKCNISVLISDRSEAGALEFADQNGIASYIVKPISFSSPREFGEKLLEILAKHHVKYVILAGYLKKIPDNVISQFQNKIVNIHPALLPAFGGKGMYGRHVHEAVFNSGVHFSGVTVHLVNNEYDAGPILLQKVVDIHQCQSAEEIAEKVLAEEHQVFSEALKILLEKKIDIKAKRVIVND